MSKLKLKIFEQLLRNEGLVFIPEYRFDEKRRWKIDYYFEGKVKLAVEIEGGIYSNGRHVRPSGFIVDMEKYNALTTHGIYLFRLTYDNLNKKETIETIKKLIN